MLTVTSTQSIIAYQTPFSVSLLHETPHRHVFMHVKISIAVHWAENHLLFLLVSVGCGGRTLGSLSKLICHATLLSHW
jgi:hypothetical protein